MDNKSSNMKAFKSWFNGGKWIGSPALIGFFLLIVGIIVNFALQQNFFKGSVLASNLGVAAPLVFVAIGQTIVILTGGIDLSVGAVMTLANVVVVSLCTYQKTSFWLGGFAAVAVSLAVGVLNGFLVSVLGLQPLLATFATMTITAGVALEIMPQPGGQIPGDIYIGYGGYFLGLPVPLIVIILGCLFWALFRYRRFGLYIRALGGNDWSAKASGIPVNRVRMQSYLFSALFAGLAGLVLTAEVSSGDPLIGNRYVLNSIAAVVLGGTALSGGRGSVRGSVAGALFFTIVGNIVFFANVSSFYQQLVSGVIIVIGLAGTALTYHHTSGRRQRKASVRAGSAVLK